MRGHPSVLEVRFHIYAAAKKWEYAAEIARAISEFAPDDPFGFIQQAYSLHELKLMQEARAVLLPVVDKFPKEYIIRDDQPYNETRRAAKACLVSIMGRMAAESCLVIDYDEALASNLELAPGLDQINSLDAQAPVAPDSTGKYRVPVLGRTKVL